MKDLGGKRVVRRRRAWEKGKLFWPTHRKRKAGRGGKTRASERGEVPTEHLDGLPRRKKEWGLPLVAP